MKGKLPVTLLLFAATLLSCHKTSEQQSAYEQAGLSDTLVTNLYKLGAEGHYEAYVSVMASCDNTTDAYKKQTALALKQHNDAIAKSKKGVAKVEFLRAELHDSCRMANCFLNVTFNDGTSEEILFPLVKVNEVWKVQ